MDPITILGISLACIVAGEAALTKMYVVVSRRLRQRERERASSLVSDTM